ncbi:hypothetical protein [Lelliottia wanjuensis]|uniref:hypothetical protein n=1 Tax=Lelliottia wanjuensis TaxID=3050585 RepID=UPI00254A8FB0|nr:hypothetical protein [Lelliottia sp. V104_15]MDK9607124.1 hypothetical protein [Lelliottia sp. V104_15]
MSTNVIELSPSSWSQVYTGPTDEPISVEKLSGSAVVWLAIGTAAPIFTAAGHYLQDGRIKDVTLESGEFLYAFAGSTPSASLIITD